METCHSLDRTQDVWNLLETICRKGAEIWLENGRVHYKAPKHALDSQDVRDLQASKGQIAAMLQCAAVGGSAGSKVIGAAGARIAPLAFSQLAHWNLHQLGDRRSVRGVATAVRLKGFIDIAALQKSLRNAVRRHSALRTRIGVSDGHAFQQILGSDDIEIPVFDLSALPRDARESEEKRLIRACLFAKIDVTRDPLFATAILHAGPQDHVLMLGMEHIISDGVSLNILLRDIFDSYVRGDLSAPEPAMQFAEYAANQRGTHARWLQEHGAYWEERLRDCRHLPFPAPRRSGSVVPQGLALLELRIDRDLTATLRRWCRSNKTTLVMCMFAAYIAFILRRCQVSDAVFLYQSDGRFDPREREAIGYFAVRMCVRVGLRPGDTLLRLISRVTDEYCNSYEHMDFSYLDTPTPRPEYMRNTCFNWATRDADHFAIDTPTGRISVSDVPFEHRVVEGVQTDAEPVLGLYEAGDEIHGQLQFQLSQFSFEAVEEVWQDFMAFVQCLLVQPDAPLNTVPIFAQTVAAGE